MGKYEEHVKPSRSRARGKATRSGKYEDPIYMRLFENKNSENIILCVRCGRLSDGYRPIIQCDFCPCSWHMDCLDPPLANPPFQRGGSDKPSHVWMCPNHAQIDLGLYNDETFHREKIRRPKNARLYDIEVLPDEEQMEMLEEQNGDGTVYRLPEKGIQLDFITRVKQYVFFLLAVNYVFLFHYYVLLTIFILNLGATWNEWLLKKVSKNSISTPRKGLTDS